jgi:hypothetical protein
MLLGSPADFGKLIAEDTQKWAKVVKFAGTKADDPGLMRISCIHNQFKREPGSISL